MASLVAVITSRLAFFILFLASQVVYSYEEFQALGFGIFTGNAPVIKETIESCVENTTSTLDGTVSCPGNVTLENESTGEMVCLECVILNEECGCNTTTLQCDQATGVLGGTDIACYLGLENLTQDIQGRASVMEAAVELAFQLADSDEKILKIFNAPEFFWRSSKGAYPASYPFDELEQISATLEAIANQERFKDWLFVFGTVVAYEEIAVANNNETQYMWWNFAPIFKGTGERFLAPKRYVSSIDFLSDARLSTGVILPRPDDNLQEFYDNSAWEAVKDDLAAANYTLIEHNWFFLDDLSLSIEICLDFDRESALRSHILLSGTDGAVQVPGGTVPPYLAQISLVTSAGMQLAPSGFVLTSGGSIFLQDGLKPHQPQLQTCMIMQQDDASLLYGDCQIKQDNDGNTIFPDKTFTSYDLTNVTLDGLYSTSSGILPRIHVFEPVAIATVGASANTESSPTATPTTPNGTSDAAFATASIVSPILFMLTAFLCY